MINYDEFYNATFISKKEYSGFKRNKNYTIKINENKGYGLIITVFGENDFNMTCPYCNLKSIQRVWEIKDAV
jgi:hypothetical protein